MISYLFGSATAQAIGAGAGIATFLVVGVGLFTWFTDSRAKKYGVKPDPLGFAYGLLFTIILLLGAILFVLIHNPK